MADAAPFSTYPEDRAKLLDLARKAELSDDANAVELGDMVRAILEDEAVAIASDEADLRGALTKIARLRSAGNVDTCAKPRALVEQMERIAVDALAQALAA